MTQEDINYYADRLIEDLIADGPEFQSIVEFVTEEGGEEDDWEAVAVRVRQKLAHIGTAIRGGLI